MCYYNGIRVSRTEFIRLKQIEKELSQYKINLNRKKQSGFEYSNWPVIIFNEDYTDWELTDAHWEFIPGWVKDMEEMKLYRRGIDPKTGRQGSAIPWFNAKGETLLTSRMFRDATLNRRCLFLSSYFFESRHEFPVGKKGKILKTPVTYPYLISLKEAEENEIFYMLGIWNPWTDESTGEIMITAALITTEAPENHLMAQVHNSKKRMPVMPPRELAEEWVSKGLTEQRISELATYQAPTNIMRAFTVARDKRKELLPLDALIPQEEIDPTAEFDYPDLAPLIYDSEN